MKTIYAKDGLKLSIYTFGFEPKGECILFIVKDDEDIIFCRLIDVYIDKEERLIDLLEKENINKLNYLCITHPDSDHCTGLDKIIEYIDLENTITTFPSRMFDEELINCFSSISQDNIKHIKELVKDIKKNNIKNVNDFTTIIDSYRIINSKSNVYNFSLYTISPISSIINNYKYKLEDNSNIGVYNNNFCVTNYICIGDIQLLLCSDINDDTIKILYDNETLSIIDNIKKYIVHYLKIPHHSSDKSKYMFNFLENNSIVIGGTTLYRSSNLPKIDVLNSYKDISDVVISTGKVDKSQIENKYGIFNLLFDLDNKYCEVELFGDSNFI